MAKNLKIAFVWHFHQPSYQENNDGDFLMPWAGLHATKDYLSMLKYIDKFEGLKLNFNITPTLLDSIERYANGSLDACLKFLLCDENKLTEKDKAFIIDNYFDANYTNMVLPRKHYEKLYKKKFLKEEIDTSIYSNQDYADIITNFNLCWINKEFEADYPELKKLFAKEKNYSKKERQRVYEISTDIIKRIIPEFRKYFQEKKIEISTSPYYHPILPLLLNINELHYPYSLNLPLNPKIMKEDANAQVQKAIKRFKEIFGKKPKGMWLSEQCISKDTVKLLNKNGIKWTISEFGILEETINREFPRDFEGNLLDPFFLTNVYTLDKAENTNIIFSDSLFTNLIGFTYGNYDPVQSAQNLYEKIKNIQSKLQNSPNKNHIITIAMDGENCWECYPNNGKEFLEELFNLIVQDKTLKTVCLGEYLEKNKETTKLPNLSSGSWINRNFDLWIGEPVKNLAWSYIATTIEDFKSLKRKVKDEELLEAAQNEIHVAQSSDWFWWYGEPNDSGRDYIFDHLFRERLKNVYRILGVEYPQYLDLPLISMVGKPIRNPRKKITPYIDGTKSIFSDNWKDAGCIFLPDSPTFSHRKLVKGICYGFDDDNLYFKIEINKTNTKHYKDILCQVFIYIQNHGDKFGSPIRLVNRTENIYPILQNKFTQEIKISLLNEKLLPIRLSHAMENNLWARLEPKNCEQAYLDTIEAKIPLKDLLIKPGQNISFCVVDARDGTIEEVYPQDMMINLYI